MSVVLVAGGGTGGHVIPALATARALQSLRPELAVEFVGTADRLEARLAPAAGFRLHTVEAAPMPRGLSIALVRLPFVLARATRRVTALIRHRGAGAAVSFGGYTAVPLVLAARRTRIPLVVHEQNAAPGLANRLAARWASAVAVASPAAVARFRHGDVVVTGNPVRHELVGLDRSALRAEASSAFGLEADRLTLLAFGGSLGARHINEALVQSVGRWAHPERLQILHVAGEQLHAEASAAWEQALRTSAPAPRVVCLPFIDRMDLAYAAADLVLARAGATTIAELTVLGLPSVLVPYPLALADEQTANARVLVAAGAAAVVDDAKLDGAALVRAVEPLVLESARRDAMASAARRMGRPDAAEAVARLVLGALDRVVAPVPHNGPR